MSKLWPSTFFCAFSIARLTRRVLDGHVLLHAQALHQAGDALGAEDAHAGRPRATGRTGSSPGSPWRPARPRSWLSMRRDSWRSVPRMCRPPAARTSCFSASHCALYLASASLILGRRSRRRRRGWPAALVAADLGARHELGVAAEDDVGAAAGHVGRDGDAPLRPACATMKASRSWCFAFRTLCGMPFFLSSVRQHLGLLDADVPTRTGWPRSWQSSISLDDRAELPALVLVDDVCVVLADHRLVRRDHA